MKLSDLWNRQAIQQGHWPVEDVNEALAEHVAGIHEEATELKKALGLYRQNIKGTQLNTEHAITECVDVFKHLLSLMLVLGITPEQFTEAFFAKSDVVDVRWVAQADFDKPVIILDMDDVLASYASRFEQYAVVWAKAKGLHTPDNASAESAKKEFREQGEYLKLNPVNGAKEGFDRLKENGCVIGIITARPGHEIKRVYLDTVRWLMINDMMPDFIVWERDKLEALSKLHTRNPWGVLAVVENDKNVVHSLSRHGYDAIWYGGKPEGIDDHWQLRQNDSGQILCADNWNQVTEHIQILLNKAGGK